MRMIAFIQARIKSNKLPGKVLKLLAGKPMLWHVIHRVRQIKLLHDVVVATSYSDSDSKIVRLCDQQQFKVFTGSENDVVDRIYHAAQYYQAQAILRVKADCPFIDPSIVTRLIHKFNIQQWDYAGINTAESIVHTKSPRFPDGLDAEIIRFSTLQTIWREAQNKLQREYVTPYLFQNSDKFTLGILSPNQDYSNLRLTVDSPSDYAFAKLIYKNLYIPGRVFSFKEIIKFFDRHTDLMKLNQQTEHQHRIEKAI